MIKSKIYLLIYFIMAVFMINIVKASEFPLLNKVIYIDAGHGGADPGAVYSGVRESDIVLDISKKVANELEKNGAIVYLTREGDYDLAVPTANRRKLSDLSNRVKIINDSKSDLFISIHLNAESSGNWYGAQTFYNYKNERNILLANTIQKKFVENKLTKRKAMENKEAYMYKNIDITGVLIEVGFITNYHERSLLKTENYQEKISKVIADGIIAYYKT